MRLRLRTFDVSDLALEACGNLLALERRARRSELRADLERVVQSRLEELEEEHRRSLEPVLPFQEAVQP